jgi:hypothetical protein
MMNRDADQRLLAKTFATLRPQPASTASIDSGITSRSASSSSLGLLDVALNEDITPMEPILEYGQDYLVAVQGQSCKLNEVESKQKPIPELSHHLNVTHPTRKTSTGSATSEKYETPPMSPNDLTSQTIPVESSSSSSSTPQEVRIKIEMDHPALNEVVRVDTSTVVSRKLRQLQLNFYFMPTQSPPSSSPTTQHDVQKKRLKLPSKSFDGKLPQRNRKMLSTKSTSLDETPIMNSPKETLPRSPCLHSLFKSDRNRRRHRNSRIASIIKPNMVEFVDSTDIDSLCPYLFAKDLLSCKDVEDLQGIKSVRGKKNFFYLLILPSKGVDAYQKLLDCLREDTAHSGHSDLVKIIDCGLKQHGDQDSP